MGARDRVVSACDALTSAWVVYLCISDGGACGNGDGFGGRVAGWAADEIAGLTDWTGLLFDGACTAVNRLRSTPATLSFSMMAWASTEAAIARAAETAIHFMVPDQ